MEWHRNHMVRSVQHVAPGNPREVAEAPRQRRVSAVFHALHKHA